MMNFTDYQKIIKSIKNGKHLPDAIYLHNTALEKLPASLLLFLNQTIKTQKLEKITWNIIKFSKYNYKLSLLHYPDFFSDPFPSLYTSYTVDLDKNTYRTTQYKNSKNPPILHRKETFLLPSHPAVLDFKKITHQAEKAGLFENKKNIGFKKNWAALLEKKGLRIQDNTLIKINHESIPSKIDRHKTAIDRNSLSTPVQSLYRHNYLNGEYTLFDYGCGKGDDINILKDHDVQATGWDPIYYPYEAIKSADIINLGFVINIIESLDERNETLKRTYKLAKKILVVSVMLGSETITKKYKKYSDGVVTSRNTFQKYYTQNEFRQYLEITLNESSIAVGPGLFYIFKDKIEEQHFLINRQRRKKIWQRLSYTDTPEKLEIKQKALYERHKSLFNAFWNICLEFGRIPAKSEFKQTEQLRAICGSHQRAFDLLLSIHDKSLFKQAEIERKNDLLVHFALSLFSRRKPYKKMPENLQKDIKYFFEKYTNAIDQARKLLFAVGNTNTIKKECKSAFKTLKTGRIDQNHSWTIHINFLQQLPPILRIYIGCATHLYGDLYNMDLIKIHMQSNKVSLMRYDNFENTPLPLLQERIKTNLREQRVDIFTYGDKYKPQPLYLKSNYIDKTYPNYKKQIAFDKKLKTFTWLDLSGFGPQIDEFKSELLNRAHLKINGFRLYEIKV